MNYNLNETIFKNHIKKIARYLSSGLNWLNKDCIYRAGEMYLGVSILVAGNIVLKNNFVASFIEEIGEKGNCSYFDSYSWLGEEYWYSYVRRRCCWSCFSQYDIEHKSGLGIVIGNARNSGYFDTNLGWHRYLIKIPGKQLCYYILFWNLFLLAIDDEIYSERTADVMSLAAMLGFNEAMMRDWCRAVEYVMEGNMFSKDCDFQCETDEGKTFFLHQDQSV